MVGVKVIGSDPDFQPELAAAGSRLAVVKFTMPGYVSDPAFSPLGYLSLARLPHTVSINKH